MIHGLKLKIAGQNEILKRELAKSFQKQDQTKIKKIREGKANLRDKIAEIKKLKKKGVKK